MTEERCSTCNKVRDDPSAKYCSNSFHLADTKFNCMSCGNEINEGEHKTFGVCDDCWCKHYKIMKDNGAMSYTEGSEPIKLTEEQSLEVKIWNVFRDNQYSSRIQDHIDPVKKIVYEYAAERLKEASEAIEDALHHHIEFGGLHNDTVLKLKNALESLKSDSK